MALVTDAAFNGDPARYSSEQWERACLIDKGDTVPLAKQRFALPVREPDGTLNTVALAKAADQIREAEAHELVKDRAHRRLAKRVSKAGLPVRVPVAKAKLSSKQRNSLSSSDFVFPDTREYPIPDESHARNALSRGAQNETGSRLAKIRAAVKRKFPGIDVSKAEVELSVPIWKNEAKQIVYGVVLTPGVRDSQGDIVTAGEIEKAAHGFLTNYRKHDVQHSERAGVAHTVESFVAPQDIDIAGQKVLKGSWVMGVHVPDAATWERCSKADHPEPLTGFSIGGTGERLPEAA